MLLKNCYLKQKLFLIFVLNLVVVSDVLMLSVCTGDSFMDKTYLVLGMNK